MKETNTAQQQQRSEAINLWLSRDKKITYAWWKQRKTASACVCESLQQSSNYTLWVRLPPVFGNRKQYQTLICCWAVQARWNMMEQHCCLPIATLLCDWYFLLFPRWYWFSFLSVEFAGPASSPLLPAALCQHYFTEDAPVDTEYTPAFTAAQRIPSPRTYEWAGTHPGTHQVNTSLGEIN